MEYDPNINGYRRVSAEQPTADPPVDEKPLASPPASPVKEAAVVDDSGAHGEMDVVEPQIGQDDAPRSDPAHVGDVPRSDSPPRKMVNITAEEERPDQPFELGDSVEVRDAQREWWPAKITALKGGNYVSVRLDDDFNTEWPHIHAQHLRHLPVDRTKAEEEQRPSQAAEEQAAEEQRPSTASTGSRGSGSKALAMKMAAAKRAKLNSKEMPDAPSEPSWAGTRSLRKDLPGDPRLIGDWYYLTPTVQGVFHIEQRGNDLVYTEELHTGDFRIGELRSQNEGDWLVADLKNADSSEHGKLRLNFSGALRTNFLPAGETRWQEMVIATSNMLPLESDKEPERPRDAAEEADPRFAALRERLRLAELESASLQRQNWSLRVQLEDIRKEVRDWDVVAAI